MRSTPLYAPDGLTSTGGDPERFSGIRRDYTPEDVERLSGSFRIRHTIGGDGCGASLAPAEDRAVREYAGRPDRQPGGAAGEGWSEGDLPVRLAGRGRCQLWRAKCIRTSRCIR